MKVWVVGRRGLLGGGVEIESKSFGEIFVPTENFIWSDSTKLRRQFSDRCRQFSQTVGLQPWTIMWCAGKGTLSSSNEQMDIETLEFEEFLNTVSKNFDGDALKLGSIFFASTAGGVYARSENPPFTENTIPQPDSAYGSAKLRQEGILLDFSESYGTQVVIGRISNLYGANQDFSKNQGLISTICNSILRRQPINLFVPLETSRNYIHLSDAAKIIVNTMRLVSGQGINNGKHMKLIVADENLTVGNILSVAKSVFRIKPLVTVSAKSKHNEQPRVISFRSVVLTSADSFSKIQFNVGIKRVMQELRSDFMRNGWRTSNSRN